MSITFTITTSGTNPIPQGDISSPQNRLLSIGSINDTITGDTNVMLFTYEWYLIDVPTGSTASIDESPSGYANSSKNNVMLNDIDVWGTYRVFAIATYNSDSRKSEENPLKAPEAHFINITVKSTHNELEKPANFQRNWKDNYSKLVSTVESTSKSINNIKVSNSTTFTLPVTDGTSGQIIKTDGSGNLSFGSISSAELSNFSLESLTNVHNASPSDGQVLKWDEAEDRWYAGNDNSSSGGSGISLSDISMASPASASGSGSLVYNNSNGQFTYTPPDLSSIPSSNSDLSNGENYITLNNISMASPASASGSGSLAYNNSNGQFTYTPPDLSGLSSGSVSWNDLTDKPTIPTSNSDISNGENYITLNSISMASPASASGSGSLAYNNSNGQFTYTPPALSSYLTSIEISNDTTPQLGGNLDINGNDIISVTQNQSINLAPNGNGVVTIKGNSTGGSGQLKLNCENNSHGIIIKGPPHSAGATYTLTLPNNDGNPDQVLKTNGSGALSWVDQSASNAITGLSSSGSELTIDDNYTLLPASSNNVDLGAVGYEFKDLYMSGVIETSEITMIGLNHIYCLPKDGINSSINSGFYVLKHNLDSGANTSFSTISYSDIVNTPSLSTVATSGSYSDLSDKPTLGSSSSLNVGTNASNVVQLDVTGKLPAIDGSQLTGISASGGSSDKIEEGDTSVEVTDTGTDGKIEFKVDDSLKWKIDNSGHLVPSTNGLTFTNSTCNYHNSTTVTIDSTASLKVGMQVTGSNIPVGATIASITNSTTFELSASATSSSAVTNITLTFHININLGNELNKIDNITARKLFLQNYSFGNEERPGALYVTGAASSDFMLNFDRYMQGNNYISEEQYADNFAIPFYQINKSNDPIAESSQYTSGHVLVRDVASSYEYNYSHWGPKLPSTSNASSGDIMSLNSSKTSLQWEDESIRKLGSWTSTYSGEWSDSVSYPSSPYTIDGSSAKGKSDFIFSFKNNSTNTCLLKNITFSCLEMYSSKIYWCPFISTSDTNFANNTATSMLGSSGGDLKVTNLSSTEPGVGTVSTLESGISADFGQIDPGHWLCILVTGITQGSSGNNDKHFTINVSYETN